MKNKIAKTGTKKLPEPRKEKKKRIFKFHKFREIKEEKEKQNIMDAEKIQLFRMIIKNSCTLD